MLTFLGYKNILCKLRTVKMYFIVVELRAILLALKMC